MLNSCRVEPVGFLNTLGQVCSINHAQVSTPGSAFDSLPKYRQGLATIANMGAEVGATSSTFPYTPNMQAYLRATGRSAVANAADEAAKQGFLSSDEGAEYDEVIEIVRCMCSCCDDSPLIPIHRTYQTWSLC